jgi:hypothetical protein
MKDVSHVDDKEPFRILNCWLILDFFVGVLLRGIIVHAMERKKKRL